MSTVGPGRSTQTLALLAGVALAAACAARTELRVEHPSPQQAPCTSDAPCALSADLLLRTDPMLDPPCMMAGMMLMAAAAQQQRCEVDADCDAVAFSLDHLYDALPRMPESAPANVQQAFARPTGPCWLPVGRRWAAAEGSKLAGQVRTRCLPAQDAGAGQWPVRCAEGRCRAEAGAPAGPACAELQRQLVELGKMSEGLSRPLDGGAVTRPGPARPAPP